MQRDERGFTIVESMVVLAILALLMAIAYAAFIGVRNSAWDSDTKLMLYDSAKVQQALAVETGYTDDPDALSAILPQWVYDGSAPEHVHVVLGDVVPGDSGRVLMYARSKSGTWFGVQMVLTGSDVGRNTCAGVVEADMTLTDCLGSAW